MLSASKPSWAAPTSSPQRCPAGSTSITGPDHTAPSATNRPALADDSELQTSALNEPGAIDATRPPLRAQVCSPASVAVGVTRRPSGDVP